MSSRRGAVALAAAVLVYLALAAATIRVGPGPHYDEALFEAGAVQMLTSPDVPTFTHPPYGWVRVGGRFWPVMVMPYAGAISSYLLLPVFAAFGPGLVVGRVAAALLTGLGLWGFGRLMGLAVGAKAAAAAVLVLAMHPGFLSNTVFNDSGFAYWVAALGAACLALRGYLARRTAVWAAAVGLACGVGVWTRLNFAWLIAAAVVGALIAWGRRAVPPTRHVAAAAAGALVGAAPLVGYQLVTRGRVTLSYMASFDAVPRSSSLFASRLRQLSSALLYDDEHRRGLWDGPPALPVWQLAFVAAVVAITILAAFVGRDDDARRRWHRALSVSFLTLAGVMLLTRLPVREHHFLTLVPLATGAAAIAAVRLLAWRPAAWPAVAVFAVVYTGIAAHWDWAARRGLVLTGGHGLWSDAILTVAQALDTREGPRVCVFDWGFDTSMFVVTNGRVRSRELFWHPDGPDAPVWKQEIVPGGRYLTHADSYVTPMGAAATARFRQELARSGLTYRRSVFNDRRGRPHSELVEVSP